MSETIVGVGVKQPAFSPPLDAVLTKPVTWSITIVCAECSNFVVRARSEAPVEVDAGILLDIAQMSSASVSLKRTFKPVSGSTSSFMTPRLAHASAPAAVLPRATASSGISYFATNDSACTSGSMPPGSGTSLSWPSSPFTDGSRVTSIGSR